jgi:hypothetical protein
MSRKSLGRVLVGAGLAVCVPSVIVAVTNTFQAGTPIKASEVNKNFSDLETSISTLQGKVPALEAKATTLETRLAVLEKRMTGDGAYSLGASYCGMTASTKGDLSGISGTPGNGWGKVRAACKATCNSPTAHMCSTEELTRSAQIGLSNSTAGWYAGDFSYANSGTVPVQACEGWTYGAGTQFAATYQQVGGSPAYDYCNTSHPVLCCD